MRFNFALKTMLLVAVATSVVSCNKSKDYKDNSRATGWRLDGKDGSMKYQTDYQGQETGPGLVFVEGGTFTMGKVQDDVMHDWNNTPTQQHVQSFYMDETEVTNRMYLQYLDWLKFTFPPTEEKYANIYKGALPDTLVWRNRLGYNETMTNNYLRHPAYQNYPVVGVNWIQATEFSKWRTDRVNELQLEQKGYAAEGAKYGADAETTFNTETYINAPSKVYGGNDSLSKGRNNERLTQVIKDDTVHNYVQRKDGVLLPEYRLPTEAEWEYAALGLAGIREYNQYRGRKKYPWDGQYTRQGGRRKRGDQLANFKQGDGDYGGIAGWSDDGADITAEIKTYPPNDFGLYDMAGNVAEWVADVYRPIVDDEFNDFNYFRGNVYTKNAINKDGTVKLVTSDSIVYDTLSNGSIVARTLPGQIKQEAVTSEDTYLRTQFSESDNRDFRDGDRASSRYYMGNNTGSNNRMYNSPQHSVSAIKDSTGVAKGLDRQYDTNAGRTTLIDNEVRVFKGGSWRDRAYYLDPAQRRYFPQDMATDYIGFRNAMSRVGSKSQKGKKARH
ncbi:gliding motility lipoprotein GldJ [Mesonia sp.]|uniref:gliding motility lipoprotein GldJ n=1 Tax=Mesonia sp. TaxID=1960830 RepID=UPI00176E165D|nr:gliding motility lipoprotein GldJ [Mesonia sp.]HIB36351.1 gliding motility lipoprotein GldJ [Mesonia sp.]HIO27143.1 gliding motility lipoprotein GldJ [Flavobacteriaceae bacterium]